MGKVRKYEEVQPDGRKTVVKLTEEEAKERGLTESNPEPEPVQTKKRTARNK